MIKFSGGKGLLSLRTILLDFMYIDNYAIICQKIFLKHLKLSGPQKLFRGYIFCQAKIIVVRTLRPRCVSLYSLMIGLLVPYLLP